MATTHSVSLLAKSVEVLVSYQAMSWRSTARKNSPLIRKTWERSGCQIFEPDDWSGHAPAGQRRDSDRWRKSNSRSRGQRTEWTCRCRTFDATISFFIRLRSQWQYCTLKSRNLAQYIINWASQSMGGPIDFFILARHIFGHHWPNFIPFIPKYCQRHWFFAFVYCLI